MSNMKCPICGEKIEHIEDGWCNCKNRCLGSGSIDLWLQFIRTKKQLEIAVNSLYYLRNTNPIAFQMEYIENALDQITALKQKDVK